MLQPGHWLPLLRSDRLVLQLQLLRLLLLFLAGLLLPLLRSDRLVPLLRLGLSDLWLLSGRLHLWLL